MAWRLFDAKPLPEPMLVYCQLDSCEQILVKFESESYHFHSGKCIWNCCLPKWQTFLSRWDELMAFIVITVYGGHYIYWHASWLEEKDQRGVPGCSAITWGRFSCKKKNKPQPVWVIYSLWPRDTISYRAVSKIRKNITSLTFELLLSFIVISDVYMYCIPYKTTLTQYFLTQWISKIPTSLEIHWVRHIKWNCLLDQVNFLKPRAWQIVLISNTVYGSMHLDWMGLHLFNDDTCPSGHISHPSMHLGQRWFR